MRRSLIFAACAAFALLLAPVAEASFHKKVDRDAALAQVASIVDTAEKSKRLTTAQVATVRAEILALKQKDDGLTLDDLKHVDRIRQTFVAADLKSVLLDKARVYVARTMDDLRRSVAHVIWDHAGKWAENE